MKAPSNGYLPNSGEGGFFFLKVYCLIIPVSVSLVLCLCFLFHQPSNITWPVTPRMIVFKENAAFVLLN